MLLAPRKEMRLVGGHWRNDAELVSSDEAKRQFEMFMRRNEDFPENFSIGLRYNPQDGQGDLILLRCNGKHGNFNRSFDPEHPHSDFHIHRAEEAALEEGSVAEKNAVKTLEYASYEEAVQYFIRIVALSDSDVNEYFPRAHQIDLPLE